MLVACAVAGFVGVALGWSGAAGVSVATVQVPFVVSGVFGGLALAGASLALLSVHLGRRRAAAERQQLGEVIRLAAAAADRLPSVIRRG